MAPRKFTPVPGFTPAPDLNTQHAAPATEADVIEAATAIILEATPHHTITRLADGKTVRIDRLEATAAELEAARLEKILRREQRSQAAGSSDPGATSPTFPLSN